MRKNSKTLLIASQGGHLTELLAITKDLQLPLPLILSNFDDKRKSIEFGFECKAIINPHTSVVKYCISFVQACYLWAKYNPKLVITTGAGLVIPYLIISKLTKTKLVFVESLATMGSKSRTAKFASWLGYKIYFPDIKIKQ